MNSFCFWLGYFFISVWGQEFVPGTDFFSPGILVLLQFNRLKSALFLGLVVLFVQEGVGSLNFGLIILLELGMFFLFIAGTWLLTPANLLFVFVYFFALTIYRFALIWVLSSLQELVVEVFSIRKLVVQLLVYLAMWLIVFPAYKKLYGHEPV
jgi:hypothetical protein